MNKKVKIIIMDDVHIEGRSQNQIVDFQNNVKSKNCKKKKKKLNTIKKKKKKTKITNNKNVISK